MKFTDDEWAELSRLLDEALELPASEQHAWLDALRGSSPGVGTTLRELLLRRRAVETDEFLATLPQFDESVATDGRVAGPYRLLRKLGTGGMGEVWLAERIDGLLKRPVALKLPQPGIRASVLGERFASERDILAALSHPNVARLYDAGVTADGQPFLALEYVDGKPLGTYCDTHRLDITRRLALFLQVLDAVQYAHARLVVHRDLKPSNILVTGDGSVRLLDFGIAKLIGDGVTQDSALTQAAGRLLTPDYASPEQIAGAPLTIATDVYSLGVILYELLTGDRPYRLKRDSRGALEEAILDAEIARPSVACNDPRKAELRNSTVVRLSRTLRGDLDTIVLTALEKSPARRYASVAAFADDIRRYLAHEPVSARPASLGYRAGRFVRRNRVAVGLSALAMLALLGGLAGTITQASRATRQAAIADEERNRADRQARAATEQRDFALRELSRATAINDLNAFLLSDAAPSGKPFTAGELLARAEAIVERQHVGADANRAEMLVAIGRQHQFMEHDAEARRLLERAYDIARTLPDRTTKARAACALATALGLAGERERAEALWREGMAQLPDDAQYASDRIACFLQGGEVARDADNPAEGIVRVKAAQALLPQLPYPSPVLELHVFMELAESYRWAGQYAQAIATFDLAYSDLVALGRENTEVAGTIYANWASALEHAGQPLKAEELYRRAIRIGSDEKSDKNVRPMLLTSLARLLIDLEQFAEAVRLADRAYERARASGDDSVIRETLLVRARAISRLGDRSRGEALLDEAESRYRLAYSPDCVCFASFAFERAALALARGDANAAIVWADKGMAIVDASNVHRDAVPYFLVRRAELELSLDRFDRALVDADGALRLYLESSPAMPSSRLGRAYLARARALYAMGRTDEAHVAASSAVEQLRPALGAAHRQTKLAERVLTSTGARSASAR